MMLHEIRKKVKKALAANDLDAVAELAKKDRRVITVLIKLSYDKESVQSWRAIRAMGLSAKAIMESEYEFLRETVRKLLWSVMEESGAIGWSAPEMLGEIAAADPARFHDLIPIIPSFYGEEFFRAGVVYALMKVAKVAPEEAKKQHETVMKALTDPDPLVRVYAMQTVRELKLADAVPAVAALETDGGTALVYDGDDFSGVMLASLAREVLDTIKQ